MNDEIAFFEELHESHLAKFREVHKTRLAAQAETIRIEIRLEFDEALAAKAQEYDTAITKLEQDAIALREQASRGEEAQNTLTNMVKNTGELLAARSKEVKDLKIELAAATERCVEMKRRQSATMEELRVIANRATEAVQRLILVPSERSQDPVDATVHVLMGFAA